PMAPAAGSLKAYPFGPTMRVYVRRTCSSVAPSRISSAQQSRFAWLLVRPVFRRALTLDSSGSDSSVGSPVATAALCLRFSERAHSRLAAANATSASESYSMALLVRSPSVSLAPRQWPWRSWENSQPVASRSSTIVGGSGFTLLGADSACVLIVPPVFRVRL